VKNSVKGMDKNGRGFEYVRNKFPNVSDVKIKEGIFRGPQIRELMQDKQFDKDLNETERNAWFSFKRICKDFLGTERRWMCNSNPFPTSALERCGWSATLPDCFIPGEYPASIV